MPLVRLTKNTLMGNRHTNYSFGTDMNGIRLQAVCILLLVSILLPLDVLSENKKPVISQTETVSTLSDVTQTQEKNTNKTFDTKSGNSAENPYPENPENYLVVLNTDDEPARLVLRNREILTVRAEVAGLDPEGRVQQMRYRFNEAISSPEISDPEVKYIPPYGSIIMINGSPVVSIAYLDIDPFGQKTHEQVVADTVAKLPSFRI